jgi:HSP20 family protein
MIFDLARREQHPLNSFFELVNAFDDFPRLAQQHRLKTDLKETSEGYEATFDVPGIAQDNLDISYENQVLTVSVSADEKKDCCEGQWRVRERQARQASRSFHLPDVDAESIHATLKEGVLSVTAKKTSEAQTRRIAISAE